MLAGGYGGELKTSMRESDKLSSGYFNESLARGLRILRLFNSRRSELPLVEITRLSGLNRATTIRLLATLVQLGLLERDAGTRVYKPALGVLTLGYAALSSRDLYSVALPLLERLSQQTNETVNMGVLLGHEVLYIVRIARVELVKANVSVGSRLPAYCTSMGKVLLGFLSEQELSSTLEGVRFEKLGPNTILNRADLIDELRSVALSGFAIQDQEVSAGLRGVAAPIRDASEQVVAAINIAVPATRVSREEMLQRIRPLVIETAYQVSLEARLSSIRTTIRGGLTTPLS